MILSDRELRLEIEAGHIRFDPDIDRDVQIQDASIDVRLGPTLRVPDHLEGQILAPHERVRAELQGREVPIPAGGFNLRPQEFVLGHTHEKVAFPSTLQPASRGKARLPAWV